MCAVWAVGFQRYIPSLTVHNTGGSFIRHFSHMLKPLFTKSGTLHACFSCVILMFPFNIQMSLFPFLNVSLFKLIWLCSIDVLLGHTVLLRGTMGSSWQPPGWALPSRSGVINSLVYDYSLGETTSNLWTFELSLKNHEYGEKPQLSDRTPGRGRCLQHLQCSNLVPGRKKVHNLQWDKLAAATSKFCSGSLPQVEVVLPLQIEEVLPGSQH